MTHGSEPVSQEAALLFASEVGVGTGIESDSARWQRLVRNAFILLFMIMLVVIWVDYGVPGLLMAGGVKFIGAAFLFTVMLSLRRELSQRSAFLQAQMSRIRGEDDGIEGDSDGDKAAPEQSEVTSSRWLTARITVGVTLLSVTTLILIALASMGVEFSVGMLIVELILFGFWCYVCSGLIKRINALSMASNKLKASVL